jgi:hypothetical protein
MLSKSLCVCLLVSSLAIAANCARADDGATTQDLRCLAIGLRMINLGDAQHRTAGTMITMYYVGKLAGRTPDLDLESAFLRQLDQMKPDDYAAEARRCGAEVTAKGNQLVKVGKDLQAKGK